MDNSNRNRIANAQRTMADAKTGMSLVNTDDFGLKPIFPERFGLNEGAVSPGLLSDSLM